MIKLIDILNEIKVNKPIVGIVKKITPEEWEMLLIRANEHTVSIVMKYGYQRGSASKSHYPWGDFVKSLPMDKQIQLYKELYDELKDTTDNLGKKILGIIK